jgi:SOS response regulatory protein OraA/RecX
MSSESPGDPAGERSPRERALALAGRELARRPMSRARLRERLTRVAPDEVCEAVVSDLERLGYVDDDALALSLADQRLADGWGRARVESDLVRLGVEGHAREAALERAEAGEAAAATALLSRSLVGGSSAARRAWGLLSRRGFSSEAAEEAIDAIAGDYPGGAAALD